MSQSPVTVPAETMRRFIKDVFLHVGVPEEDAEICSEILIAADLQGIESHGIQRLKMYYDRIKNGQHKPITNFEIIREGPTTAVVDGHHGVGMVIGKRAMQMAIDKARQYGLGAVAVRNSTHFGIDGYYAKMAIDEGMIGLSFTNARPSTAPTFGVQPMLGTNPIAFGTPTDEDCPFLFDAATSIVQRGKVEVYDRKRQPIPEGWVIDQQNQAATDAGAILTGLSKDTAALLPLGGAGEELAGYKGYGLATIVEILCASLQTGSFLNDLRGFDQLGNRQPFKVGHFFMAINISSFTELNEFKSTTGQILRQLRASRKAPDESRIYTAGEKEFEKEKMSLIQGIPVIEAIQKDMLFLQKELGLHQYQFPFS